MLFINTCINICVHNKDVGSYVNALLWVVVAGTGGH